MGRNFFLWLIIVIAMVMLFNMFQQTSSNHPRISYTEFLNQVNEGQIVSVIIQGNTLIGRTSDNHEVQAYAPRDYNLVTRLMDKGIEIRADPPDEQSWFVSVFVSWFPMLLLVGVWIFFMR
ncbi:MAG: ATP-dependent metallopeptidase FtsH/Yme1/Tma family protein, partial [Desulfovibrio sp.]|nr:ATP-dependent metallopeptidase FtsH/Yme1/Tma family protein [Desulfovibrio sp.]